MPKQQENCYDAKSYRLNYIALILSIFAFILSAIAFGYDVQINNEANRENISVIAKDICYDDNLVFSAGSGYRGQGALDGINYSVIVSNNSKKRVSFVSFDFQRVNGANSFDYSDMILQTRNQNNEILTVPFSLDAGESVELKIGIRTLISPQTSMALREFCNAENATITADDFLAFCEERKQDVFGNDLTTYSGNWHFPVYRLRINTSQNTYAEALLFGQPK